MAEHGTGEFPSRLRRPLASVAVAMTDTDTHRRSCAVSSSCECEAELLFDAFSHVTNAMIFRDSVPALYEKYLGGSIVAIDEYTLSQAMAADTAGGGLKQLEDHYATFIVSNQNSIRINKKFKVANWDRPRRILLRLLVLV